MWDRRHNAAAAVATGLCLFCTIDLARGDVVTYQRVVGKGDRAPGTPAGVTFGGFAPPAIGPTGQVVFGGALTGPAVDDSNNSGYWAGAPGALGLAMRKGAAAPGTNTTYGQVGAFSFLPPPIDSGGNVMFSSPLNNKAGAGGLWAGPPGGVTLLGQSGGPVPDMPGYQFAYNLSSNDPFGASVPFALNSGRAAFTAGVFNDPNAPLTGGLWAGPPGEIHLAARTGAPAPGIDGATLTTFVSVPALNPSGTLAFRGRVAGPGINGANEDVIFTGQNGVLGPAVRTGMAAPGTNKTFAGFNLDPPGLNSKGQIAFGGQLRDAQGRLDNGSIWAGASDALRLVAETGAPAPGTGGTFVDFNTQPAVNDLGQVAFIGTAETGGGGSVHGVWAGTADALQRVVSVGEAAPIGGTVPAHFSFLESPWLNNAGQVAFYALLDADDRSFENKQSLWVRDTLGDLHLVAREGGAIDVDGVSRTIEVLATGAELAFRASGTDTGFPIPFNDAGQLAFQAYFAGGDTALFVATVPVPEPGGAAAVLAAAALVLVRRRRQ